MQWLMLVLFVVGPALSADRIRSAGKLSQGKELAAKQETDAAVRAVREATEIDPSHARAHHTLGQLYVKQNKHLKAVTAFESGLKVVGDDGMLAAELSYHLGDALFTHSDAAATAPADRKALRRRAVAAYTNAISSNPAHHEAYYSRAVTHDRFNDPDAADADFRQCIRVKPSYSRCFVGLANLYMDYGFRPEAIAVLEAGMAVNDDDATMKAGAGQVFMDLGKPQAAIKHYREALLIDPDLLDALFGIGMAYAGLRDRDNAVQNLEAFLSKAGTDVPSGIKRHAQDSLARLQDAI